jgi:hypothetical protein
MQDQTTNLFQGGFWVGDDLYVNRHNELAPPVYVIYRWNGEGFVVVDTQASPVDNAVTCGQGIACEIGTLKAWWAQRSGGGAGVNQVVETAMTAVADVALPGWTVTPEDSSSGLVQPVVGGGVVPHPSLYPRPPNKQQISRARRRLGLYDGADEEVVAATVIADVAARQALVLERDEQKRFEELLRKLELQGIEFDARYLEALNIQRERLIDAEIAARQRLIREDEEILILLLMAASVA